MATTVTKMQHIVKVAEDEYLILHPETDADLVHLAAEGITADTVEGEDTPPDDLAIGAFFIRRL